MYGSNGFIKDFFELISDIPAWVMRLGANYQTHSLVEITNHARVEPLTIISNDLVHHPEMTDIAQTALHLFIGYYLQAVSFASSNRFVLGTLAKLNPDRHLDDIVLTTEAYTKHGDTKQHNITKEQLFINSLNMCLEAYDYRLPITSNAVATEADINRLSNYSLVLEANDKKTEKKITKGDLHKALKKKKGAKVTKEDIQEALKSDNIHIRKMAEYIVKHNKSLASEAFSDDMSDLNNDLHNTLGDLTLKSKKIVQPGGVNQDAVDTLKVLQNLGVGALINIEFQSPTGPDGKPRTINVPISFRLATMSIANSAIQQLLVFKTEANTLVERYHAWRSGRIGFIKDLMFCHDLIKEYKKALFKDKTGVMAEIARRVKNGKLYGLISNNPSFVTASNIFIISADVASKIELDLGGPLSKSRIRQRVFENTYAMFIFVVDTKYDRVTIYTVDTEASTSVSIKDIKNANKNRGVDVADMLKTFMAGNSPTF